MHRRNAGSYFRRGPVREPYDRVLIVCEGEKTEPFYFRGLRSVHRLSSANVVVTPANGSDPISIVNYAEARLGEYERVYCVFDRNGHQNYDEAVRLVAQSAAGRARKLIAITSWPCFEFWLLLHFRYSDAPFARTGRRSASDVALHQLTQLFPEYQKKLEDVYERLRPRYATACQHATRLQRANSRTQSQNPSTRVHELVNDLLGLKG